MVSGLLRHVVWYMDVNVSEDCGASFFRVEVRGASESELLYNWLSVSLGVESFLGLITGC
jgi:hypothetical protein